MNYMQYISLIFLIFLGATLNASEYCDGINDTDLKKSLNENCKVRNEDNKCKSSHSKINFNRETFERSTLKAARVMLDAYGLYAVMEIARYYLGKELSYADSWREWQICAIAAIIIYPFMYNEA